MILKSPVACSGIIHQRENLIFPSKESQLKVNMFYNSTFLSSPGRHGGHPDGVGVPPQQELQGRGQRPGGAGGGLEARGEPHRGRGRGYRQGELEGGRNSLWY